MGVEYDMVEYEQGEGPEFSRADWMDKKFTLGMDFPNLPYVIESDGYNLTETNAVHRYFADKHQPELLGRDADHRAEVSMLELLICGNGMKN